MNNRALFLNALSLLAGSSVLLLSLAPQASESLPSITGFYPSFITINSPTQWQLTINGDN